MKTSVFYEERDAQAAWTPDGQAGWGISQGHCKRIVAYMENGPGGYIPYLRIELNDGSTTYVAAHYYEVNFPADEESV